MWPVLRLRRSLGHVKGQLNVSRLDLKLAEVFRWWRQVADQDTAIAQCAPAGLGRDVPAVE